MMQATFEIEVTSAITAIFEVTECKVNGHTTYYVTGHAYPFGSAEGALQPHNELGYCDDLCALVSAIQDRNLIRISLLCQQPTVEHPEGTAIVDDRLVSTERLNEMITNARPADYLTKGE